MKTLKALIVSGIIDILFILIVIFKEELAISNQLFEFIVVLTITIETMIIYKGIKNYPKKEEYKNINHYEGKMRSD